MYAVIRRYNVHPGTASTVIEKVNGDFLGRITQLKGFVSYQLIDPKDDTVVSVSVFDDKQSADESTRLATEWVRSNLHHQIRNAPVITTGDVAVTSVEQPS